MISLFNTSVPIKDEHGTPTLVLFGTNHRPWTPRHLLLHWLHSLAMLVEGALGVITLGLYFPGITMWMENGGLDKLYDHDKEASRYQRKHYEEIAREMLGLTSEQITELSNDDILEMAKKSLARKAQIAIMEVEDWINSEVANDNGPEPLN